MKVDVRCNNCFGRGVGTGTPRCYHCDGYGYLEMSPTEAYVYEAEGNISILDYVLTKVDEEIKEYGSPEEEDIDTIFLHLAQLDKPLSTIWLQKVKDHYPLVSSALRDKL